MYYNSNYDDNSPKTYGYPANNRRTISMAKQLSKKIMDNNKDRIFKAISKYSLEILGEVITIPFYNSIDTFKIIDYVTNLNIRPTENTILTTETNSGMQHTVNKKLPIDSTFLCKDMHTICIIKYKALYSDELDSFFSSATYTKIGCNYVITITFVGRLAKKYKTNVRKMFNKINNRDLHSNKVNFYDDETDVSREMTLRSFDSVISSKKQIIIDELENFCNSKDIYHKHNITYQLGILLYGVPGCGKTTMIRAIVNYITHKFEIGRLVWFNIGSCNTAVDVERIIKHFRRDASSYDDTTDNKVMHIVLIEELDQICQGSRADTNSGDTISQIVSDNIKGKINALLQFLDGINSVDNTIVIATTNYINKLDDALIRDGRFNCKIEMVPFNKEEAKQFCDMFGVGYEILEGKQFPISPVSLQKDIFRQAMKKQ